MPTRLRSTRNSSSECTTAQRLSILSPDTRALHVRFISLFLRFFTNNSGWTLPALFATLRDLRDLAFDVSVFPVI
jgi:tRNA(Met) C34 N-acetyltransferase TmcA